VSVRAIIFFKNPPNTIDSDGWEVEQGEHGGDDSPMDDVDEDAELAAIMQESWHAKE
jgi:hypothetical protein